mmetsp:Transcript_33126/g.60752  ORF Transcript_33126/g.60752 Transcript_33126/m.60752 type:complete len:235 (+) Transcript_33126:100-804(+)
MHSQVLLAFGVCLSVASCSYMLSLTVLMIVAGEQLAATSKFESTLLPLGHVVALTTALLRIVLAMSMEERRWQTYRIVTACASCIADVMQIGYLFVIQREESPLIVSLSGLFMLDCIGAVKIRLVDRDHQISGVDKPKQRLQRFRWKTADAKTGLGNCTYGDQPCHVCLEELQEGDDVGQLKCGHVFHARCIKQWMQRGRGCPLRCQDAMGPSTSGEQSGHPEHWRAAVNSVEA